MIMVTGSALINEGKIEQALALSIEHVERSRQEPGCISHHVHVDAESPLRIVFVEEWENRQALLAHFAVEASQDFVQAIMALSSATPEVRIFASDEISTKDLAS